MLLLSSSREAKISELDVPTTVQKYIIWLDITIKVVSGLRLIMRRTHAL